MSCPPSHHAQVVNGTLLCCNENMCFPARAAVGDPDGFCNTADCVFNNPDGACNDAGCIGAGSFSSGPLNLTHFGYKAN